MPKSLRTALVFLAAGAALGIALARIATSIVVHGGGDLVLGIAPAMASIVPDMLADPLLILWDEPAVKAACLIGLAAPGAVALMAASSGQKLNDDTGKEHGDSRLAADREMGDLLDRRHRFNNFYFTEHAGIVYEAYSKSLKAKQYARNFNFIVLGISGLGKTFNLVLVMLMEAIGNALAGARCGIHNAIARVLPAAVRGRVAEAAKEAHEKSAKRAEKLGIGGGFDVFTSDPKGDSLRDTGHMFLAAGFDLRVMNTVDFDESCRINPLAYIKTRHIDIKPPSELQARMRVAVEGIEEARTEKPVTVDTSWERQLGDGAVTATLSLDVSTRSESLDEVPRTAETIAELQRRIEGLDPESEEFSIAQAQLALKTIEEDMGGFKTEDEEGNVARVAGRGCKRVADAVRAFSYKRSAGTLEASIANNGANPISAVVEVAVDPELVIDDVLAQPEHTRGVDLGQKSRVVWLVELPGRRAGEPAAKATLSLPCHIAPTRVPDGVALTKTVDTLVANLGGGTDAKSNGSEDPFWEDTKRLAFMALIAFLFERYEDRYHTLPEMMRLLNMALPESGDPTDKSPLAVLIEMWEHGRVFVDDLEAPSRSMRAPAKRGKWVESGNLPHGRNHSLAVHCFHAFMQGAPETVQSVVVSCQAALVNLLSDEVKELLSCDELHLEELGEADSKTAIFCVTSDTPSPYDFLTALVVQQAIDLAQERAYKKHGGRLPRHVRFILDEVANLGKIPILVRAMAVVRSRNISIGMFLQSKAQLALVYGDKEADVMFDNCSTLCFLGAQTPETLKMISEKIGEETVYARMFNRTFSGLGGSSSQSEQIQGTSRAVMSPSQLQQMSSGKMLCFIYNHLPIYDQKIQTTRHPLYRYINPTSRRTLLQPPAAFDERFSYREYRKAKEGGDRKDGGRAS